MKQFEVPNFYHSPIIAKVKAKRKLDDPRKKDFSALELTLNKVTFIFARHFGFCYGVENAIERSYKAIKENPDKRIFLISEMIHNPNVNEDLKANGIQFLQDTNGKQLIPFESITKEDIVIIPAFGTTIEIENCLKKIGVNIETYNTTCPFVEKVWNRSQKLGETDHTIVVHGKLNH
ncbi:MAG: 4-hydroxy-3-methylbut-2-enyl diphosphate reductase, partial [Flavobacteriales bacterium]|nr:4-hydroxy-3-methylbut-2-enyl diphosphate reductase [Flavobacteriales bacterium]